METELIDVAVMEAPPEPLTWNKLQRKMFRYLTSGDTTRLIALASLIRRGAFDAGASFEEVKDILDEYSLTEEVRQHFCDDGQQRFRQHMKHKEPPPKPATPRVRPPEVRGTVDNCGCSQCVEIRRRESEF
jgi:hypothetical protein